MTIFHRHHFKVENIFLKEYVHTDEYLRMIGLKRVSPTLKLRTDYFKVIVVRNPYERILSAYKDKILSIPKPHGNIYGNVAFDTLVKQTMRGINSHIKNISTFDEMLRYLNTISGT